MKAIYLLNNEQNGVEIYFDEKPGEVVRDELKANKFRWNKRKSCWYAKQNENTLALAEKLTTGRAETEAVIKSEIHQKKAETKLTIESMEEAAKGYTFKETGEGLYAGWTGCNYKGICSDQELKKAILSELKKNGIKATAKTGRGTGHHSFTFTVRVPEEHRLNMEQFIERQIDENMQPYWYRDCTNQKDVHREALWNMDGAERDRIIREHWTHTYEWRTRDGECIPTEPFQKFVETIVASFNSDHSNGMIDYFDRCFYDSFTWKCA